MGTMMTTCIALECAASQVAFMGTTTITNELVERIVPTTQALWRHKVQGTPSVPLHHRPPQNRTGQRCVYQTSNTAPYDTRSGTAEPARTFVNARSVPMRVQGRGFPAHPG